MLFSNHDGTAEALLRYGVEEDDPLWRLPLHKPYRRMLDSKVADINNVSESGYAGAITAALFLDEFVEPDNPVGPYRHDGLESVGPSGPAGGWRGAGATGALRTDRRKGRVRRVSDLELGRQY